VKCSDASTFSISAKVSSKSHPSRHIYFEPQTEDGYSEAIYGSTLTSEVTNTGSNFFWITASWAEIIDHKLEPGSTIKLPSQNFKDYRIVVATADHDASIEFDFSVDRPVTSKRSWNLIAAWADGP